MSTTKPNAAVVEIDKQILLAKEFAKHNNDRPEEVQKLISDLEKAREAMLEWK